MSLNDEEIGEILKNYALASMRPEMTIHKKDGTEIKCTFQNLKGVRDFTVFMEEMMDGMKKKAIEATHPDHVTVRYQTLVDLKDLLPGMTRRSDGATFTKQSDHDENIRISFDAEPKGGQP